CDFFRGMSGKVEVVFEEGTHSAWLYKLLKPLVASVTVCDPRHNKLIGDGSKSDDEDAEKLAHLLRMGSVKSVYKGDDEQQRLKELCRAYENLLEDSTRNQNRLKAIYRGRGIDCSGHAIYRSDQRAEWLAKLSDEAARFRAESLLDQLESLSELRKKAKQRMIEQARRRSDYSLLLKLPGFGPVRVAQLIAIVGTPHPAPKAYYQRLVDEGARPEIARVSLARKLAAIALVIWQRRQEYDAKKTFAQA